MFWLGMLIGSAGIVVSAVVWMYFEDRQMDRRREFVADINSLIDIRLEREYKIRKK